MSEGGERQGGKAAPGHQQHLQDEEFAAMVGGGAEGRGAAEAQRYEELTVREGEVGWAGGCMAQLPGGLKCQLCLTPPTQSCQLHRAGLAQSSPGDPVVQPAEDSGLEGPQLGERWSDCPFQALQSLV